MQLSLLLERVLAEDTNRDAMLNQTVKNPDTNQDITVRTALGYDKNHPARKAAARIYAQYMQKQQMAQPAAKPAQTATPTAASAASVTSTGLPATTTSADPNSPINRAYKSASSDKNWLAKRKKMQSRRNPSPTADPFNVGDDGYDAMRDRDITNNTPQADSGVSRYKAARDRDWERYRRSIGQ